MCPAEAVDEEGSMSATTRQGGHSGGLSMTVDRDGDARVQLTGTLDPVDVPAVRDELALLLRDVDRVLVDITRLAPTHPSALRLFPAALEAGGGWPAARLAVVYGDRSTGQALRASRVDRQVAISDEPELALLRCADQPAEVRAGWSFTATAQSPARCRAAAGPRLASWSVPEALAERAILILNELVTNAVQHTGLAGRTRLVLDERALWLGVRDFGLGPVPGVRPPGLGLQLVDMFAARWGFESHPDGKTGWARLLR
jgi:signal transduction histidine kinase